MSSQSLKEKISFGLKSLRSHWSKPPEGYYVSYHEFFNLAMGSGSLSFMSVLVSWTTLAMNIPMMLSYFKVSSGFIFVAGIAGSVIGLIRAPILSMVIDNTNSSKGKFKPFLIWSSVLSAVCFTLIPFIPESWTTSPLFSFGIPSMPVFAVEESVIEVTLGSLVMFVILQIGTFFYTLLSQCLTGIEQTISPVSQERANIGAFKGLISNLPSSVVNIVMPALAGAFFAVGTETGMNNILLYRIFFPICGVLGVVFVLFAYFGTEERTVVHKEFVSKVKFWEGAKELTKNKYFWIITIYNVAVGIRGNINMYLWICSYAIGGKTGDTVLTVCNMVLNNALIPGMLLGPLLIKKFGKRRVMIGSTVGFTAMAFLQLVTIGNPYIMLVGIFFQNLFNGLSYISSIMVPDALDYQQWKTGKRLEGFWQNYSAFITTFLGIFTSALMPLFMSFGGVGFGDSIDVALKDTAVMNSTFTSVTWLGIIGAVICMVPMIFYDLTEAKHANYIRALRIRAAVQNYKDDILTQDDIDNIKEISEYANEKNDRFILDELELHDCISQILNHEPVMQASGE